MRRKGKRPTVVSVIVAGTLVIVLLAAGTVLRMRTRDVSLAEAFRTFAYDTFHPWQ